MISFFCFPFGFIRGNRVESHGAPAVIARNGLGVEDTTKRACTILLSCLLYDVLLGSLRWEVSKITPC